MAGRNDNSAASRGFPEAGPRIFEPVGNPWVTPPQSAFHAGMSRN